jgi:hypothetical protein
MKPKKSFCKMKGKNGILLFVEFLKGLLEANSQQLSLVIYWFSYDFPFF